MTNSNFYRRPLLLENTFPSPEEGSGKSASNARKNVTVNVTVNLRAKGANLHRLLKIIDFIHSDAFSTDEFANFQNINHRTVLRNYRLLLI